MRRVLFTLGFVVALASALLVSRGTPAEAITCSISHVYTTGETLTSAVLNANPTQFNTCFASIDHLNIGPAGIYASQIIPTTAAQATFGGSQVYTFPSVPSWTGALPVAQGGTNLTSLAGSKCIRSASTTALAESAGDCVTAVTASGNLSSSGGTTPAISMTTTPSFSNVTTGTVSASGGLVINAGSGAASVGLNYNNGSSGGVFFYNGGVSAAQIFGPSGTIQTSTGVSPWTNSYVPPVYTASGGAVASTEHIVHVTGTFNSTLGACGPLTSNYYCATVTLSGAAAFSSGGTAFSVPPSFSCNFGAWIASTYAGYWFTGTSFGPVYMAASTPNTLYVATQQTSAAGNAFIFDCEGT